MTVVQTPSPVELDELLSRAVADILPTREELKKKLTSGKQLKIYIGADPTADYLHIGHGTNFIFLEKLRRLGHKIFVLFGTFTARIGDPTDKSAARVRLSAEEVEKNIASWKEQLAPLISFDDAENPAEIVRNGDWLGKLSFEELIDIASHFTVQRMLERDMFERRLKEEKPIYLHEFFYPLMQGYDSVALDVDLEIGGSDQLFNMLAGRTLQDRMAGRDKMVLTTTLLEDAETGKKLMSKSEGTGVRLNAAPAEMFGQVMALADGGIRQLFTDCTLLPLPEIEEILEKSSPRDAKFRAAKEIVSLFHGEEKARAAGEEFEKVFSRKEMPTEIPSFSLAGKGKENVVELLVSAGLAESKSAARRLIEGGGVSFAGARVESIEDEIPASGEVLKVGKRRFLAIDK
jgi:tyrosyl-tRNA synthetase